jgi:hypothetical protein
VSSKVEFEGWAIVEIMGHRRLAGSVREVTIAGGPFLRIDIASEPPATQYYGAGALFSVTPTTEEEARKVMKPWGPVHRYELASANDDDDDGDENGDDDDDMPDDERPF